MKMMQSALLRAACTIIIGVLLIKYREETVTWLTIAIGALFLLSGVISIAAYYSARRTPSEVEVYDAQGRLIVSRTPTFPIVGIGSILLGTILAVMPGTFINALMYVIGAILILGAINQYLAIISVRRFGVSSLWFWLCPTLILLFGAFIIIKPMAPLSTAMFFLGWLTLFYGIVEALNSMLFYIGRRRWEKEQEELLKGLETTAAAEEMTDDGTQEAHEESEQRPSAD